MRSVTARTIVCLSSQPWDDGMWTNKQHIMSRLAKVHRVVYVNFGYCSSSRIVRLKREHGGLDLKIWNWLLEPVVHESHGLTVLDFYAPGGWIARQHSSHPAQIFSQFDLRLRLLKRYLAEAEIHRPILWVYHPGYGAEVARIPHELLVYDCVDEYTQFPEYRDEAAWLRERESALCRRADVVFTTAPGLYENKRDLNPDNTYLVHNVGDAEHFEKASSPDVEVPSAVASLEGPVIGFVGAVSNYKLNVDWVLHMARERPAWHIVIIGPVGVGDPGTNVEALRNTSNVHLLGHREYAALPAHIKGFDVAMIPYRINEYTTYSFPIKFFEFLATGKPVVISPLPAVESYWDSVLVAHDQDELIARCEQALADPDSGRHARIELARENSWPARIAKMMEQVERRLTG